MKVDSGDGHRDLEHVGAVARILGAEGYERSRIQPHIARIHAAMLAAVPNRSQPPGVVLDVGCGTGRLLRRVAARWPAATLIGVDPEDEMISVARRLAPSVSFHVAAAETMPVAAASIDLAFCSISFHHWTDQLQGLREVARILRPGGYLCLADLSLPRWAAWLLRSGSRSPAALRQLLAAAGLEVEVQRLILARVIVLALAAKPAPTGTA